MITSAPTLSLEGIAKNFGPVPALADIELSVHSGEFVSLLGPSGCGKSTLLSIVAGILQPDAGNISIAGRAVQHTTPYERDLGMVFQDYALFPHMSVEDNIAFGLRMRRGELSASARADRVSEMLKLVRLSGLQSRYPAELSGGQQQRVAIARALAPEPQLLLMDEPLSNLDAKVREEMRAELKEIQRKSGVTTLYVTHDQEEALALSDRVVVLSKGRIAQTGTPSEVYSQPLNRFVADFIGRANLLDGRLVHGDGSKSRFQTRNGLLLTCEVPDHSTGAGMAVIRPEQVELHGEKKAGVNIVAATIKRTQFTGAQTLIHCAVGEDELTAVVANWPPTRGYNQGDKIWISIPPEAIRLID